MVVEEVVSSIPEVIIGPVQTLVYILQAAGILAIFYIIFTIVNAILNRKRVNEIKKINENLEDIKKLLKNK
ncbi:hypothetical protein J4225_01160 [Candidatus Pacearchaeota archaeon]|nr:hypothetical protein [Candidatus Pacearchaeota archaeon]